MVVALQKGTTPKIDTNIEIQTAIVKVGYQVNVNVKLIERVPTVKRVTTWVIDTVAKQQKDNILKINTNIEIQTAIVKVG